MHGCPLDGDLKLDVVACHHKTEHAQTLGAMLHRTFINSISDAARAMLLPLLPESKICRLGMDNFFQSRHQHFLARFLHIESEFQRSLNRDKNYQVQLQLLLID